MKGGRSKNGETGIEWIHQALKKYERKTIGFGAYNKGEREYEDEIHIREMNLIEGALGCAIWDGAVILTRWIHENPHVFDGASVIELGAGCGLPGILAARFAAKTVLTDYIDKVVENLKYNLLVNATGEEKGESEWRAPQVVAVQESWRRHVAAHASACHLDWDDPLAAQLEPADILLGAELTYSLLSIDALIQTVEALLKPGGVFYHVLSDDRDGVSVFVERIRGRGFTVHAAPVPKQRMGNFNTRSWTFQDEETYTLYTFARPQPRYPPMTFAQGDDHCGEESGSEVKGKEDAQAGTSGEGSSSTSVVEGSGSGKEADRDEPPLSN